MVALRASEPACSATPSGCGASERCACAGDVCCCSSLPGPPSIHRPVFHCRQLLLLVVLRSAARSRVVAAVAAAVVAMGNTYDTEIARIEADHIQTKWRTTEDYRWGYGGDRGNY